MSGGKSMVGMSMGGMSMTQQPSSMMNSTNLNSAMSMPDLGGILIIYHNVAYHDGLS